VFPLTVLMPYNALWGIGAQSYSNNSPAKSLFDGKTLEKKKFPSFV
jgi:hypothetical protein